MAAGAEGGKICGAGGGGFMMFVVKPENRTNVRNALSDLDLVSLGYEVQGSRVLFSAPEWYGSGRYAEPYAEHRPDHCRGSAGWKGSGAVIFKEMEICGAYVVGVEKNEDQRGFFARGWCRTNSR